MPRMAFMGVRISWLTLARNSSLARLAASAASLAWRNSSSSRLRSEMSWTAAMAYAGRPDASRWNEANTSTQTVEPSLRRYALSQPVDRRLAPRKDDVYSSR